MLPVYRNSSLATPGEVQRSQDLILAIAKATLKELAVALAFAGVASFFVATTVQAGILFTTAITVVAINILIRTCGAFFHAQSWRIPATICNYLAPYTFSTIDQRTRDVLIHEAGHALAAKALFVDAAPRITISAVGTGSTSFVAADLTHLGKYFGKRDSELIVAAAGPALAVITSSAHLAVAHLIRKKYPTLSRYLQVTAIVSVWEHVKYAFSALSVHRYFGSHDFVALKLGGIHPITAIIGMVALPLLVQGVLTATC